MNKKGLGKGLSALIPLDAEEITKDEPIEEVRVADIKPNTFQPRRTFNEEKLRELAESIKEHGVLQPIIVRAIGSNKYELVVGERRLRACQIIKKETLPAVIKDFSNQEMMEIALVENIQRQDLSPIEEAYAYRKLIQEFNLTQEQVAQRLAKSRSLIANMIRILNLPQEILDMVEGGLLTVGHARPLLAIADKNTQVRLAKKIIDNSLTARDAENLTKEAAAKENITKEKKTRVKEKTSPVMQDLESKLRDVCRTKVRIKEEGKGGKIEINYYNNDDFERIMTLFFPDYTI